MHCLLSLFALLKYKPLYILAQYSSCYFGWLLGSRCL